MKKRPEYCRRHLRATAGPYVQFGMTDTGVGMEDHVMSHIFEPFVTTKDIAQGSGLLLSMVYGIVKNHRGFIE